MKKYFSILLTFVFLGVLAWGGYAFYHRFLRPMRIAIVAEYDSEWVGYQEAVQGTNFAVHRYKKEEIAAAPFENYDLVMLRGMGWQPTDAELENVRKAAKLGAYIQVSAATRDSTRELNNIPKEIGQKFGQYASAGGAENLGNGLRYLARELKGYKADIPEPKQRPRRGFFHLDGKLYETLQEYDARFDAAYPKMPKDAPRVVLTGAFINFYDDLERGAVDLINRRLAESGCRVYALAGMGGQQQLEEIKPDVILFTPMGSLVGAETVTFLQEQNIPCINIVNIMDTQENWLNEPTAMTGGYTGQALVLPELDGVIEPTAIAARSTNEDGLSVRMPLTSRIEMLIRRVNRWITLKRKSNADKRVVIVYYKAPGHSPLGAAGMETIDSLYNVLKKMQDEGYDLGGRLPADSKGLTELIQKEGRTIGAWAQGSWEEYLREGDPVYIPAEEYAAWLQSDVPEPNRKALIRIWGDVPGKQNTVQKDGKPYLIVTRVKLGNIALMPLPSAAIISGEAAGETEIVADIGTDTVNTNANAQNVTTTSAARMNGSNAGGVSGTNITVKEGEGVVTDEMSAVHGTDQPPPHSYLGAYLWIRHGFKADAMIHFGTHGSMEFTKGKSAVLSDYCWPTILTGDMPHIYPYIINNIGEALLAKRRASAVMVTHLTPPFTKAELYGDISQMSDKIHDFRTVEGNALKTELIKSLTEMVRKNDMFKEIGYKENPPEESLLSQKDIEQLDEYLDHLADVNIQDGLHVIGREWAVTQIVDTVAAMLGEPGTEKLEKIRESGKLPDLPADKAEGMKYFVQGVLNGKIVDDTPKKEEEEEEETSKETKTSKEEKTPEKDTKMPKNENKNEDKKMNENRNRNFRMPDGGEMPEAMRRAIQEGGMGKTPSGMNHVPIISTVPTVPKEGVIGEMPTGMGTMPGGMPSGMGGGMPSGMSGGIGMGGMMGGGQSRWGEITGAPKKREESADPYVALIEASLFHANNLFDSIPFELEGIINALGGGYVPPSSGGDVIFNPDSAPTGRNMASVNLEQTPTPESYKVGVRLTENIITEFRAQNPDRWPRRVACTFWGGEYIRTRGVVLAQALYLMGLKPRRDSRNIVFDVEVIPSEELGRPRIDIVAQTSGQFRDAAVGRIELLDKAVRMVAELPDEKYPNYVKENSLQTEEDLKKEGIAPAEAREYSTARIFGSPTGSYGTGIQGTVDRAEDGSGGRIADRYISNMGGMYRSSKVWGVPVRGLFESQLKGTDMMIQSMSSNTWGPLTLDHVYEFNTLALAIREKTGTDPKIWFSDMRNPTSARAVTATQAIREEARSSIWNPKYIAGLQREGAAGAANLVEPMRNMRGWNVVQPSSIDQSLWDEMNAVYIEDKHNLKLKEYFEEKNPYALQDMTAILLDIVRKGMWKPSDDVIKKLAELHVEMVEKHGAGCSGDTCGDRQLHAFIGNILGGIPVTYEAALNQVLQAQGAPRPEVQGMQLEEKIELLKERNKELLTSAPFFVSVIVFGMMAILIGGFCRRIFF
ncbi:MAG: cobaltochelatase subunit CobN [Planctomycetaceae bacterium]|jgi:cobaltochelatase CobN|nr:cobaltochelatase subunit CobN [Planctomycetaceae bacterium]